MPKSERQVDHGTALWRTTTRRQHVEGALAEALFALAGPERLRQLDKETQKRLPLMPLWECMETIATVVPQAELDTLRDSRDWIEGQELLFNLSADENAQRQEHAQIEEEDMTDRERWNRGVSQAAEEAP